MSLSELTSLRLVDTVTDSGMDRALRDTERKINEIISQLSAPAVIGLNDPTDPRFYGAVGNDSHDDSLALIEAFSSGNELCLRKPLTFLTETTLSTGQMGFSLSGRGKLKIADGANCGLLEILEGQYAYIDKVELDGNRSHQAGGAPLIRVADGAYARIDSIYAHDGDIGVEFENINGSTLADECNLINSLIFACTTAGVKTNYIGPVNQGVGDCLIALNHINYHGGPGVWMRGGSACLLALNNILTNATHGVFLEGIPTQSFVTRLIVALNQIRNNGGSGLFSHAQDTLHGGGALTVLGNQFHFNAATSVASNADIWDTDNPSIVANYFGDLDFTPRAALGLQLSRTINAMLAANVFGPNAGGDFAAANGSTYVARGNFGVADTP